MRRTIRQSWYKVLALTGASLLLPFTSGCNSFLDPSEVTRGDKKDRLVVSILPSIDPIDEAEPEFVGAEEVKPEDLKAVATDYVIGANDIVSVGVEDPLAGGVQSVRTARVSETGMLSVPQLPDPVKAAGLTERELQTLIATKYKDAGQIINAQVTAQVIEARSRTFSILGAVGRAGQYSMVESDFRLLNALIMASDTAAPNIEYAYIIRKIASEKPATRPGDPGTTKPETGPVDDPLMPKKSGAANAPRPMLAMQQADPSKAPPAAGEDDTRGRVGTIEGKTVPVGTQPSGAKPPVVDPLMPAPVQVEKQPSSTPYEFGAALRSDADQRVIRVPLQLLKQGDLRYNVVIRPNDMIVVPAPQSGFYYMGGHVQQPGVFSLTGQKVTLKQAVIAARMLDGLAVPQRTDVIRRVGRDQEVFVRVDMAKVFNGQQPDFFLKPNDVVMVGSDFWTPFLAAFRGAFRFSYGLGFLYDRNYAPDNNGN